MSCDKYIFFHLQQTFRSKQDPYIKKPGFKY